ncbi:hypothetical protein vBSsoS008_057 [Shigella phage vB_SsoS_008]|nr:hypothetical protein vBSsoS008_057 [Shigella phage vB_SsoS_008]
MRFVDGQKVPAGEIDMRAGGLSSDDDQGNFNARCLSKRCCGNYDISNIYKPKRRSPGNGDNFRASRPVMVWTC